MRMLIKKRRDEAQTNTHVTQRPPTKIQGPKEKQNKKNETKSAKQMYSLPSDRRERTEKEKRLEAGG